MFGPGNPLYDPRPTQQPFRPQTPPRLGQQPFTPWQQPQQPAPWTPPAQPAQPQQTFSPTITTSITPTPIYSPQQTQGAVNVARALQDQLADPRYQMKQFAGQGRSQDAGTLYAAMPNIAGAKSAGALAGAAIPLEDLIANQKHLLSGEIAREDEAMGWGNLIGRQYDNQVGTQNRNSSNILSVLSKLLLNTDNTDYSALLGGF